MIVLWGKEGNNSELLCAVLGTTHFTTHLLLSLKYFGERILKIGQHLTKLMAKNSGTDFSHTLYISWMTDTQDRRTFQYKNVCIVLTKEMAAQYRPVPTLILRHLCTASNSARNSYTFPHFPTIVEPEQTKLYFIWWSHVNDVTLGFVSNVSDQF